jgi:hypothetical protein
MLQDFVRIDHTLKGDGDLRLHIPHKATSVTQQQSLEHNPVTRNCLLHKASL